MVTGLADGGFVIAWYSSDGSGYGIYAQRYAADGSTLGGEFLINAATGNHQAFAALNLGPIARRAVAMGRAAIHGAGRAAVRLSVAQDSEEDLKALSRLLQSHLVPASMIRPA